MGKTIVFIQLQLTIMLFSSFHNKDETTYPLTVAVKDLRNSNGVVQFALYDNSNSFPDEHYEKYFRKLTAKIINGTSEITFENLPPGKYAVNILHDEDEDGKIKKGIILPKEGIGFSNYQSIGLTNRPAFKKASFNLSGNKKIEVKIIYL
jgi:uncharacterized protein (DUF2141 family)